MVQTIVPAKYSGRVTMMTVIALVLVAISLTMPYYGVSWVRSVGEYDYTGEVTVYDDHVVSIRGGLVTYSISEEVEAVMSDLTLFVNIWLIFGVLFVGATLLDLRVVSFALGWIAVVVAVLAVFNIYIRLVDAVYDSYLYTSDVLVPDGFIGEVTAPSGSSVTYGPLSGFIALLAACVIQVTSVLIRMVVIVQEKAREAQEASEDKLEGARNSSPP